MLYGVKPVVIAVVVAGALGLARTAIRSVVAGAVALAAGAATRSACTSSSCSARRCWRPWRSRIAARGQSRAAEVGASGALLRGPRRWARRRGERAARPVALWPLFAFFLKIGSVLFGSGYVLLAFLRADLVERRGWLTRGAAARRGRRRAGDAGAGVHDGDVRRLRARGGPGAAVATLGIFLPAFVFVASERPLVPRLRARRSRARARRRERGVARADGRGRGAARHDRDRRRADAALAAASAACLLGFRVNSSWLVLVGAIAGYAARLHA